MTEEPEHAVALGLEARVERLVADLRAAAVPVGLAGVVDAMEALRQVDIGERAEIRVALRTTLVKRERDLATFDLLFDAWFPSTVVTEVVPGDLRDRIVRAVADADVGALRQLAAEAAAITAAGDGRGAFQRVARMLGVSTLTQDALRAGRSDGDQPSPTAVTAAVDRFLASLRDQVLARRRVQDDGGPDAALFARPEDVEIAGASTVELRRMREAIQPLARRLAARLRDQRNDRRGALDVRRTIRRSLPAGGVPIDTAWRRQRPHRPDLWLLCDVSGSVAEFARFTVALVAAARDEVPRTRAFVFDDDLVEVTDALADRRHDVNAFALVGAAAVGLAGRRSDWGRALRRFEDSHGGALGPRSTIVVTGDGRSHGGDPGDDVVERLCRHVRSVSILVPERRDRWGTGDSALPRYAAAGAHLHEVCTVSQLGDAVAAIITR
jgi:uncharacterized protein with von Willebrand factor type A (vWA) domain